jgi:hypothetical protein
MPSAVKLDSALGRDVPNYAQGRPWLAGRSGLRVARDFAALLAAALGIGFSVGLGIMLAVLVMA